MQLAVTASSAITCRPSARAVGKPPVEAPTLSRRGSRTGANASTPVRRPGTVDVEKSVLVHLRARLCTRRSLPHERLRPVARSASPPLTRRRRAVSFRRIVRAARAPFRSYLGRPARGVFPHRDGPRALRNSSAGIGWATGTPGEVAAEARAPTPRAVEPIPSATRGPECVREAGGLAVIAESFRVVARRLGRRPIGLEDVDGKAPRVTERRKPVPKSSIAMRTPSSCSRFRSSRPGRDCSVDDDRGLGDLGPAARRQSLALSARSTASHRGDVCCLRRC